MTAGEDLERHVRHHVMNWLIKTPADPSPHRVTGQDITLIVSCMQSEGQDNRETIRLALQDRLGGWMIQRARGERPSVIDPDDITCLLALLPPIVAEDINTIEESAALEPADPDHAVPASIPDLPAEYSHTEAASLAGPDQPDTMLSEHDPEPQQPLADDRQDTQQDEPVAIGSQKTDLDGIPPGQDRLPDMGFSRFHLEHGI